MVNNNCWPSGDQAGQPSQPSLLVGEEGDTRLTASGDRPSRLTHSAGRPPTRACYRQIDSQPPTQHHTGSKYDHDNDE